MDRGTEGNNVEGSLTKVLQHLAFVTALPPDAAWLRIDYLPWPEIYGRLVCGTFI
jgi:hypothetical protein